MQWYTEIVVIPVFGYQFLVNWPKNSYIIYGVTSYFGWCIWIWYVVPHCFSLIFVFHQMCYYLKLRFNYVNRLLKIFDENKNNQRINELLDEHNNVLFVYLISFGAKHYRFFSKYSLAHLRYHFYSVFSVFFFLRHLFLQRYRNFYLLSKAFN